MAKEKTTKANPAIFLPAGLLAWLVPGAGHWYLGRPVRAVILFATIQGMFWSGVAIGGTFTVNPQQEKWWWRAQMCTGVSGIFSHIRQGRACQDYHRKANLDLKSRRLNPTLDQHKDYFLPSLQKVLAEDNMALVPPASDLAYVFTGVAGLLNLMCVFDAVMLALMGKFGEPETDQAKKERAA